MGHGIVSILEMVMKDITKYSLGRWISERM